MTKDRGKKQICSSCAAKFYDFNQPDPKCPKCGKAVDKLEKKKVLVPKKETTKVPSDIENDDIVTFGDDDFDSLEENSVDDVIADISLEELEEEEG